MKILGISTQSIDMKAARAVANVMGICVGIMVVCWYLNIIQDKRVLIGLTSGLLVGFGSVCMKFIAEFTSNADELKAKAIVFVIGLAIACALALVLK